MTRDDIIRMARESLNECDGTDYYDYTHNLHWWGKAGELVKFAEIVVAEEREACASIDVHLTTPDRDYTNMSPLAAYEAALMDAAMAFREAIRARGQG